MFKDVAEKSRLGERLSGALLLIFWGTRGWCWE